MGKQLYSKKGAKELCCTLIMKSCKKIRKIKTVDVNILS